MVGVVKASKNILGILIEKAVEHGGLNVFFSYKETIERTGLELNFIRLCVRYMHDASYIQITREDDEDTLYISISPAGIEFCELD